MNILTRFNVCVCRSYLWVLKFVSAAGGFRWFVSAAGGFRWFVIYGCQW